MVVLICGAKSPTPQSSAIRNVWQFFVLRWCIIAMHSASLAGREQKRNPLSQEESMKRKTLRVIASRSFALVVVVAAACQAQAQDAKTPYPSMAPLDQYLMERSAEITLARSAAPESISQDRGPLRIRTLKHV
jgi:hypothetical protein